LPYFATKFTHFAVMCNPVCDDRHHRRGVARNALSTTNAHLQRNAAYLANIVAKWQRNTQMGKRRCTGANIAADGVANRATVKVAPTYPNRNAPQ
jgi:hypothetical protein